MRYRNTAQEETTTAATAEVSSVTDAPAETTEETELTLDPEERWYKTNCHSCCAATIEIINTDREGFDFRGEFSTYASYGELEGRAVYISDTTALITDDGTIYYLNVRGTFATNDEDYTGNELPEFSTI